MNTSSENNAGMSSQKEGLPAWCIRRDELISRMLQDRSILRLVCAPHGFGKTMLVREYADRLFDVQEVLWVDAASPDFLMALDDRREEIWSQQAESIRLVILDGMTWLHEERAQALSKSIDIALYAGQEVIVTVTPSCDCISALHPDRLSIHAIDLLVTEQECVPRQHADEDGDERAFARRRWREAGTRLLGHVPAMMWGNSSSAQAECLEGIFSEKLPLNILRAMFSMLLFESGNVKELDGVDIHLLQEDITLLTNDYPLFGLDCVSGEFSVGQFEVADLRRAISVNRLERVILEGTKATSELVLGALFKRGSLRRGSSVIDVFCNDAQCAAWLEERGWDFIDAGEVSLALKLLDRCPEESYAQSQAIQAMHAWIAGLSGDRREACHISQHVLSRKHASEQSQIGCVAARIALAQFDDDSIVETHEYKLSSQSSPENSLDFLAAVLDDCSNAEVARAFSLEGDESDVRIEKARRSPGKIRARRLASLFTQHAERFGESQEYRVALHVLAHIDSVELRRLVQELGCNEVLRMRRSGVSRFSEALFVRDMWRTGYFGLVGPVIDRRDAKVLDGAAHMLDKLARCCDLEALQVPWDAQGHQAAQGTQKPAAHIINSGVDGMYVRMFGGFEITIGDRYVSEGKWRKKARALFSMLVLNNGRDVPRDDIFAHLWPGLSHTHALDNFYNVWGNCISIVGEAPYLERNGEYCRVDPRFVHSDVADFEQLTRHLLVADSDSNHLLDTYAKIEALYRGSLMPCEKNVRMINVQRERFRAMFIDAMLAATQCALSSCDSRIALWFSRKAMEEDQTREDVYRMLMKAQIAAGQRCSAIKTYHVCREFMQSTYGLDPSLETRELYDSLITNDPELLRLEISLNAQSAMQESRRS